MAFIARNLDRLQGGEGIQQKGMTVWLYRTTDAPAAVDTNNYFLAAIDRFRLGDVILMQQVDSLTATTSITATGFHVVNGLVPLTSIDTTDITTIQAADTD